MKRKPQPFSPQWPSAVANKQTKLFMFYLWFIPLAICAGLIVLGLYLRLRRQARKAVNKAKSPLDLAQEMEREEEAAEQQKSIQDQEKKKAA